MASTVVIMAPTSTTNMTGFFIMARGFSFRMESVMARLTIGGSNNGRERAPLRGIKLTASTGAGAALSIPAWRDGSRSGIVKLGIANSAPEFALHHQKMLHNGTQRKRRKKRQRPHDHNHCHQQPDK